MEQVFAWSLRLRRPRWPRQRIRARIRPLHRGLPVARRPRAVFSTLTIDYGTATLERFLAACGRPAWEVTCEDIDRVVGGLAAVGMATSTRRGYVSVFKGSFSFLLKRKAGQTESMFGLRLVDQLTRSTRPGVGSNSRHCRRRRRRTGRRRSSRSYASGWPRRGCSRRLAATTRSTAPCITPVCEPRRR